TFPITAAYLVQRISRPSSTTLTPSESSAFFTETMIGSMLEASTIEQTQPKDKNGQVSVAASTTKLLDIWSTAGTIYELNDSTISGDDCNYYNSNVKNN